MRAHLLLLISILVFAPLVYGQETHYDESRVPNYTLPDPLAFEDGRSVETAADWPERRAEILRLFEQQVYGITPDLGLTPRAEILRSRDDAFDGLASQHQLRLHLTDSLHIDLLLYVPNQRDHPAATFVALNFYGNASVSDDPQILLTDAWMRANDDYGIVNHRATEATRGVRARRWPMEHIVRRGYAVATAYCGDLDPDYDDGFENGVHAIAPPADSSGWATLGAWAWGLSRIGDYLTTRTDLDPHRMMVMGHSRLGKAALWAGAQDERFAAVISNNSGAGGAALSRRGFGETVARINTSFPHWFSSAFTRYNDHEAALPVDQHQLIALMAPRPIYIASAEEDLWADPKGEFLSALGADPVYRLLGTEGLEATTLPPLETPLLSRIGYHIRRGKHDVMRYDWDRFMDFADLHLKPIEE
ncbi:MAG: acetylxylan esterase [Rhodothermales bacterium]